MIVVLYDHRTRCPFRLDGCDLARSAGLGMVSLEALSKARGISTLFRGKR